MNKRGLGVCGICGVGVLLWTAASGQAAETAELKVKFPSGRVRYVETKRAIGQKMQGPMGKMEFDVNMLEGVVEKIESASAGGTRLQMTFDRMSFSMDNPMMGELVYDSDMPSDDDAPMVKDIFAPMVGESVTVELDKDGKAKSATGMKKLLEKIEKSAAANPFFSQMKAEMTDDSVKSQYFDGLYIVLSGKKSAVGDKWKAEREDTVPHVGKMKFEFDCKLDKITEEAGKKVAVVVFTGKISQLEPTKAGENPMGQMNFDEGTIKGTLAFSIADSCLVRHERETKMKMSMKMGQDDAAGAKEGEEADKKKEAAPSMSIEMSVKETMTARSASEREKEKKENAEKAKKKAAEEDDDDDDGE